MHCDLTPIPHLSKGYPCCFDILFIAQCYAILVHMVSFLSGHLDITYYCT